MGGISEERLTAWRRKGYIPVAEAAEVSRRSIWTIYRALKEQAPEKKRLAGLRSAGVTFVSYRSLWNFVGEAEARALKMPEPAKLVEQARR